MHLDFEILLKLTLSIIWGGIVGIEREVHNKSAGFRTMIMISLGSCLFTALSLDIAAPENRDRIAANILTGIGFLGAGVIFKDNTKINGITTAATIWTVAAVGMSIGSGQYFYAGVASILMILILSGLRYFEKWIDLHKKSKSYITKCNFYNNEIENIKQDITSLSMQFEIIKSIKDQDELTTIWMIYGTKNQQEQFTKLINSQQSITYFEY